MSKNETLLMWGAIPVRFDDYGLWEVAVNRPICKALLTSVADTLLGVNVLVEKASNHQILMRVPLTPARKSLIYRLPYLLRLVKSNHEVY